TEASRAPPARAPPGGPRRVGRRPARRAAGRHRPPPRPPPRPDPARAGRRSRRRRARLVLLWVPPCGLPRRDPMGGRTPLRSRAGSRFAPSPLPLNRPVWGVAGRVRLPAGHAISAPAPGRSGPGVVTSCSVDTDFDLDEVAGWLRDAEQIV